MSLQRSGVSTRVRDMGPMMDHYLGGMSHPVTPAPPGLDLPAVTRWLHSRGLADGELTAHLMAGGRSNLTYVLSAPGGARLVLRRPPLGHVLATAHDMGREHRVLSALHGTAVPVPEPLALCEDAA